MPPPNIILILTDDQGYGDVGRHGNPILQTPHLDELHDQSVCFDDFCMSPSCSPSRCALMTGRHEFRSGVTHTILGRNRMSLDATCLAEVLRDAGYATGIFGKWHLGHEGPYRPEHRGFDHSLTTIDDTQDSHFDPAMLRNGVEQRFEGFRTDILFREAAAFIEEHRREPFFCYLPTYSPHQPLKAPQEYLDRYEGKVEPDEAAFFAMVSNIDDNLGRLRRRLADLDLADNTLLVFMNDNGATCGLDVWNANMRGCKGTSWFGGTRALSFWHWRGRFRPRRVDSLTAHLDVFPTLAALARAEMDESLSADLDGISLADCLTGDDSLDENRMLFTHQGRWPDGEAERHKFAQCGVRWRRFHLVRNDVCDDPNCKGECRVFRKAMSGAERVAYSKRFGQFHYAVTQGHWRLFDVHDDPRQATDLAEQHPDVVESMSVAYERWWEDVSPGLR